MKFNSDEIANDARISTEGKTLFFRSQRPLPGHDAPEASFYTWVVTRSGEDWDEPRPLELGGAQPAVLMGLGLANMKKGATDQALDYFNQAVTLIEDEEILQSGASVANLHYYLGKIYLETGEIDLAAEELTEALWYNRINADAIYLLGRVYEAQGRDDEAEANYLQALSLVPNFTEVYNQLGDFYEARGDEAAAAYNHAMGTLFSGQVAEAVEQLNAVIDSHSQNADAYWGLGWGYEKLDMMEEAIAAYQQTVAIDSKHQLANGALTRLGVGMYQE